MVRETLCSLVAHLRRLLIIDDDEAMRDVFRSRLEESYEVIDTGDPEQGIALALEHKPDAILLDLLMPKFSGFELCQTLGALSFTQPIPVFIFSGEAATKYATFCKNLGAAGYFEKPVNFDQLKSSLTSILDGKRPELRSSVRIRLSVGLKLRGVDEKGVPFEFSAVTDNISANGFLCNCPVPLANGAVVNVFLEHEGEKFAGVARAVRAEFRDARYPRYGFCFVEKPVEWILR